MNSKLTNHILGSVIMGNLKLIKVTIIQPIKLSNLMDCLQ